jgi:integration host factor subunit beta
MMVRSELVQKIAEERPHLSPKDVEAAVEAIFKRIEDALASGKRVEIRGFGAFLSRQRKARMGRNPRSGLAVSIPAKCVPWFKPSDILHGRLNRKD